MSVEEYGLRNFTTGAAVSAKRLVQMESDGTVIHCTAGGIPIGSSDEAAASGGVTGIWLKNKQGTRVLTASKAISVGESIYPAADGKITDAVSGVQVGIALEAAADDEQQIECLMDVDFAETEGKLITAGEDLAAADLVYPSAYSGTKMTMSKAQGTAAGLSAMFIVPSAISSAADGIALTRHLLTGVDTSGASAAGDPVYLSDATAGAWTVTKPTGTDDPQIVGQVITKHASTGSVLFDLSGYSQMEHDHSTAAEGGDLGDHNSGTITLGDAKNIAANTSTGSEIGTAASQKLGFWGTTPVVQPTHNADPAAQAAMTAVDPTASAAGKTAVDPTASAAGKTAVDPTDSAAAVTITNPAGCAAMTHTAGTGADGTTPSGAEYALARADLDALKAAVDANNVQIDAAVTDITSIRAAVVANEVTAKAAVVDIGQMITAILANEVTAKAAVVDIGQIITAVQANEVTAKAAVVDIGQIITAVLANEVTAKAAVVDLGELDTAVDNNNAAIDAINADDATTGMTAAA